MCEGEVSHWFRINGEKKKIGAFKRGDVICEPAFHHTVYQNSELIAEPNAEILKIGIREYTDIAIML